MAGRNHTVVTQFILLGLSDLPKIQALFFLVFLATYVITLTRNLLIFTLTLADAALHTPMYFFLMNLSFLEICYTSVTLPKMLANLLSEDKTISFTGCAVQMYFFLFLGGTECFLLGAMAYDRYVAICYPLRYTHIMNHTRCSEMAAVSWISGLLTSLGHTSVIFTLPFCGSNEINHFFCDIPPVLKLACGVTYLNEIAVFMVALLFITFPFVLILVSYLLILLTILKMPSAQSRHKAFSTCSSHLLVVTLFFGTGIVTYLRPNSAYAPVTNKLLSLFYTVITPMFNPLIYSLRNKEVKGALRRTMARNCFLKGNKCIIIMGQGPRRWIGNLSLETQKAAEIPLIHPDLHSQQMQECCLDIEMSYTSEIAQRNHSMLTHFIFFRFWRHPETRAIFCIGFSIIYTVALTGNILIIFMTVLDPALHTPMYFFLRNLSFL
ncbi:olfactory receptor 10A7 [Chrysemys picta bellii]|uniref:olfactory receptor 10A7 n=1 Tax=Chrysemys picta bellii TaxID=8478 RepID=UPI0032B14F20